MKKLFKKLFKKIAKIELTSCKQRKFGLIIWINLRHNNQKIDKN